MAPPIRVPLCRTTPGGNDRNVRIMVREPGQRYSIGTITDAPVRSATRQTDMVADTLQ